MRYLLLSYLVVGFVLACDIADTKCDSCEVARTQGPVKQGGCTKVWSEVKQDSIQYCPDPRPPKFEAP